MLKETKSAFGGEQKFQPSFFKRFKWPLIILVAIVLVALATLVIFKMKHSSQSSSPPSTISSANTNSLFGTMVAFSINGGLTNSINEFQQDGWSKFSADSNSYSEFKSSLEKAYANHSGLVSQAGFSVDREIDGLFTWNVIEPQKGTFNWEITDLAVKSAEKSGVKFSAVIQPYAAWDQKDTSVIDKCNALGFSFYDFKAGPPKDTAEYENFLSKMVERYKGNVAAWEIGNEPDSQCAGYQNNPQGYLDLLKISYETIKKADPSAIVLNAGAVEIDMIEAESIKTFWTKFFESGGGQYLDKFNLHYNNEKDGAKVDSSVFLASLAFYNDLMKNNGGARPIWITEFGTYSGTPTSQNQSAPAQGQPGSPVGPAKTNPQGTSPAGQQVQGLTSFPTQSPEFQAAWYFKNSILAFNFGTELIFPDFEGPNDSPLGSSAMFDSSGQPRLFLTTLKMMNQKLVGFSKVEKITEGQYKFTVNGKTVYALWLGNIPSEISGQAKVINMTGQEQTIDASAIKLNADQPILVDK